MKKMSHPMELSTLIWTVCTLFLCLVSTIRADCPGNVKVAASTCFANYKQHYVNIQKRENTLFTGVDVEILRSFCSSYIDAMKCITDLKSRCASNSKFQINSTLADFDVAVDELSSLCLNDVVYEVYARHRTCFEMNKAYSMRCFDNIMNTSVRLLRRIDHKPLDEFCGDMKKLLSCIGNNIERNCNREAASLVEKLVKPMIRRSSQCDYYETSPPPKTQTSRKKKNKSSQKDKYREYSTDGNSSQTIYCFYNHFHTYFISFTILLYFHNRHKS